MEIKIDNSKIHVALLAGGMSSEREVSFSSANGVAQSLENLGYKYTLVDADRDLPAKLAQIKPDIAFIALHGTYGEDGCVQGVLEIMGIPYTHSSVTASAVAMDKQLTKYIIASAGILCPQGQIVSHEDIAQGNIPLLQPFVVKPSEEGSSVGVFIVKDKDDLPTLEELDEFDDMIVEEYIPGRELSVATCDEGSLGVLELCPKDGFYDFANKYTDGKTEHFMPAPVSEEIYEEAMDIAFEAHHILGCTGITRTDFRYNEDGDGKLYFLEINTHPGLTPLSISPEILAYRGISYNNMVDYLVKEALNPNGIVSLMAKIEEIV